MKRFRNRAPAFGLAGALLCSGAAIAQDAAGAAGGSAQTLPLRHVVLFSSGVGYFQRSGRIDGPASVDLSFRAEQVNDILKSLVLFDGAGGVRPVTYTTHDSIARQLRGAGRSIDGSVSLGSLLRQFQGARVLLDRAGDSVQGRIISVSLKTLTLPAPPGGVTQVEVVNVLTDDGLKAVPLDAVSRIELQDKRLNDELRTSLELLAGGLDDRRRSVALRFGPGGAREVRAGYLQEMPVWKTSYRLVLDDKQKPYLQGWAIVENTTDEDWTAVSLSLVSGRPVSFIQDLYQPLYVPRPVVQAQVIGSPTPQLYSETLGDKETEQLARMPKMTGAANLGFRAGGARGPAGPPGPPGPPGPAGPRGGAAADAPAQEELFARRLALAESMAQSVASQAAGSERGELFEYAIQQPVTLAKQKAAMVPIVTTAVEGEKLSIFDPAADAKHALNGFRLKNSTGLHLSGGPITVFEGGVYAGDAQIGNLTPGEERLLSYAVDLELVVGHEEPKFRQETISVSAKSGVLHITRKQQREHVYTFRNKAEQNKTVLIEQALEREFKLTQPEKPAEKTADEYRFRVDVAAGKTAELKVVTERPVTETIALLDADINILVAYAQNAQVGPKLRGALKELVEWRRKITELQAQRTNREAEIKAIDQEQTRIRQNMQQLDRNSALYQQYVKKLTDQESRIERLREEIVKVRESEAAAQKGLREFTDSLTAE